jgi:putative spermidine/putrescine transport system substrate-binding protein
MQRRWWVLLVPLSALALVASACGGGDDVVGPLESIGQGEGALNLIAWDGYVEDGSNDPAYDWVHPFQEETGCTIKVQYANTSDEMVTLMRQGGGTVYDGVSASGDASLRLITGGDVAEINIDLFPEYKDVLEPLQAPPHNTVDGKHYGVPYMYGPNFLMYNTDEVSPAPDSWDITFESDSPYAGSITAYDSPIFIADAAMYLMTAQPDLGIDDPYELTQPQFDAAIALLQQQKPLVTKYWAAFTDEIDGFANGSMVAGTAWPLNFSLLEADDHPVDAVVPKEGVTGWADTWMMSAHAQHPNCMYKWMEYTMRPEVEALVAVWYGAAPSNGAACAPLEEAVGDQAHTLRYGNCGDTEFLDSIYLWKTPSGTCSNGESECVDYTKWTEAWTELRGS